MDALRIGLEARRAGITQATVEMLDAALNGTGRADRAPAIGAANLRPYVQGQDDVGHAALSN